MHFKPKHMDWNHKMWGSKFCIIYSDGGHIGFNYTHTSFLQYSGLFLLDTTLILKGFLDQESAHSKQLIPSVS